MVNRARSHTTRIESIDWVESSEGETAWSVWVNDTATGETIV